MGKAADTIRKSIASILLMAMVLGPALAYGQTAAPQQPPPVAQPLVREGTFALQLAAALGLSQGESEADAQSRLGTAGIAPANGWVSDYPVTPDILAQLRQGVIAAAQSGFLRMDQAQAEQIFQSVADQFTLQSAPAPQDPPDSNTLGISYYGQPVLENFYGTQGPPVVTYYSPPPDYSYLYSWVGYPFWWLGWWFGGYWILNTFAFPCCNHHGYWPGTWYGHHDWHGSDYWYHNWNGHTYWGNHNQPWNTSGRGTMVSNHFRDPATGTMGTLSHGQFRQPGTTTAWNTQAAQSGARHIFSNSQGRSAYTGLDTSRATRLSSSPRQATASRTAGTQAYGNAHRTMQPSTPMNAGRQYRKGTPQYRQSQPAYRERATAPTSAYHGRSAYRTPATQAHFTQRAPLAAGRPFTPHSAPHSSSRSTHNPGSGHGVRR